MKLHPISSIWFPSHSILNLSSSVGSNYVISLRVGLSHLYEHKFRQNFWDTLNPICNCDKDSKTTKQFLLHCQSFNHERQSLLQNIKDIDSKLFSLTDTSLTHIIRYMATRGPRKFLTFDFLTQ